jgi:predicted DNA-binding ribbon-helix-helix protein
MCYLAADANPARGMVWLEPEFWSMLTSIASERETALEALIHEAFAMFGTSNRSASVRAYICNHFSMQVKQRFSIGIVSAVR